MGVRLDKINGFMRIYNGTRYLTLLGAEKYDTIYDKIRYLVIDLQEVSHFFSLFCKNQSWIL